MAKEKEYINISDIVVPGWNTHCTAVGNEKGIRTYSPSRYCEKSARLIEYKNGKIVRLAYNGKKKVKVGNGHRYVDTFISCYEEKEALLEEKEEKGREIDEMIEVIDTNRFGRRSGLGEGRGLRDGETRASVRAEEKAAGKRDGGGGPPSKTDSEDLKKVKRARSLVVRIEETRNDYSDEVIRELKCICASARRMIEEYESRRKIPE